METAFDGLFWLSLGLLAILIPIYVLATSHVGPANEVVRGEIARIKNEIDVVSQMLQRMSLPKEARSGLEQAKKGLNERMQSAQGLPNWLTFRRVVLLPGAFFLVSFALSVAGRAPALDAKNWLLASGLVIAASGIGFLITCLHNIERIVRMAQPEWRIRIEGPSGNTMTANQGANFRFLVELVTGGALHGLQIAFFIPPEWRARHLYRPGEEIQPTYTVNASDLVKGDYKCFLTPSPWVLKVGIPYAYVFQNITALRSGDFRCYYLVSSEERTLEQGSILIRVTEGVHP